MVYVTHDQVEAMTLADKIVVLSAGRVEQVGSPLELYHHPRNLFVAGFIGSPKMNFLETRVIGVEGDRATVGLPGGGSVVVPVHSGGVRQDATVDRKSAVSGKSGSDRVDTGGRGSIKKKK